MLVHLAYNLCYYLASILSSVWQLIQKEKKVKNIFEENRQRHRLGVGLMHAFSCFSFSIICLYCRLLGPKPFSPPVELRGQFYKAFVIEIWLRFDFSWGPPQG